VAVNRSVKLQTKQWNKLQERLKEEHPTSVFAIRDKMKKVLGFTTRHAYGPLPGSSVYESIVHLDFFDEPKRTMFLLKYGDYLERR
jgi:hypothetical protein